MPHYISDTGGGDFKKVPQGTHLAVCNLVADMGLQESSYKGERKVQPKTYIRFETPNERVEYERDGKKHEGPMQIGATYTSSLGEKANLRHILESWRGRAFTQEELARFDIFAILGKPCLITVTHKESGGKVYANITAVTALPKGTATPTAENAPLKFSESEPADFDKLPEWLQKKIQAQLRPAISGEAPRASTDDINDDIPF